MDPNDFLDSLSRESRPATNVSGDFDCSTCRERVSEAHYDYANQIMTWWCSNDHESRIKDFRI